MYYPDITQINTELIIVSALALLFLIQLTWYFTNFGKVAFYKSPVKKEASTVPVSIILCARNEGDNLTEFLPEILSQDYPEFEVIVVNDCSSDNTEDVLREFSKLFPNLKAITVKEDEYYAHGKKFALMVGIKGAKYEHLLLTDADCKPASREWLSKMAAGFSAEKEIVLGYGAYENRKGFLNKMIRFDTFQIGLMYLSAALRGRPYMGVGRNMAYKKELFFKSKNFSKHYHIKSGDDDLFINHVATGKNTAVVIDQKAITVSVPKETLSEWWRQKQRHLTTAPHYKSSTKFALGFFYATNYLFWSIFLVCLFFKAAFLPALALLLLRWLVQFIIYYNAARKLNEPGISALWFVFDVIFLFIYPALHLTKRYFRPNKWMN
jgi:cellulose synthase/poly-beta-1,6-N-acetylglucosamine synthase-like glycosyltransferase